MKMTAAQQQELIHDLLFQYANQEADFPIIEDGTVKFPVMKNGICVRWQEPMTTVKRFTKGGGFTTETYPKGLKGYRGLCLEINDHGNVTVWNCFKNGTRRELASAV